MKYSIVLLIVVSNYCMGMDIAELLNPKEYILNAVSDAWPAEPTYVQDSEDDKSNTTGAECPICHQILSSKQQSQNLKNHIFFKHMYLTLDQDLKDKIKNCKIEKNGESNFVRCVMDDCLAQLKITKGSQKTFLLKQHLTNCHFKQELDKAIQENSNAANLIKKRIRASSDVAHSLPCPVASCPKKLCTQKKHGLRAALITHLLNKHLIRQNEDLKKEVKQNWENQKANAAISCWHPGCTKKFKVSQNAKVAFASLKYHCAVTHWNQQINPFCGQQSIKEYIDKYVTPSNKKQKNA